MATAHASVADITPWQLGQPREQLHRPSWVEKMSFSAALPCGHHYVSPHKMAAKNHRLSWHCRFKFHELDRQTIISMIEFVEPQHDTHSSVLIAVFAVLLSSDWALYSGVGKPPDIQVNRPHYHCLYEKYSTCSLNTKWSNSIKFFHCLLTKEEEVTAPAGSDEKTQRSPVEIWFER